MTDEATKATTDENETVVDAAQGEGTPEDAAAKTKVSNYIMIGIDDKGAVALVHDESFNPTIGDLLLYKEFLAKQVHKLLDNTADVTLEGARQIFGALQELHAKVDALQESNKN